MTTFKKYQQEAWKTALYPRIKEYPIIGIMYAVLGLNGEAGEIAEAVKKSWRNDMNMTADRINKIKGELGDVLWYVGAVATELGLSLDDIANENIKKLADRKKKGQLKHE